MDRYVFCFCFVLIFYINITFAQLDILETSCHTLTLNDDNQLRPNVTCKCKLACGDSIPFNYLTPIADINKTRLISGLYQSGYFSKYPLWLLAVVEDYDLFRDNCKCGLFGDWSKSDKKFFDHLTAFFAHGVINLFYPNIRIVDFNPHALVWSGFNLFYPVFLAVSVFNVIVVYRLCRCNESTAFVFQIFQFIANALAVIFVPGWTFQLVFLYTDADANSVNLHFTFFTNVFTIWSQLMALMLLADRFFCLWQPINYKQKTSRRIAVKLSLNLLLLSACVSSTSLLIDLFTDPHQVTLICFLANLVITTTFVCCFVFELILAIAFIVVFRRKNTEASVQLRKRQKNINRILIGTAVTESILCLCHTVGKFATSAMFLSAYVENIPSAVIFLTILLSVLFYSPPLVGLAPFCSLVVCMCLSSMYRQTVYRIFSFKITSNSVVPLILQNENDRTN